MADFNTLADMMDAITDEDAAFAHFTAIRWKNGAFCPYPECGGRKVYSFADKRNHKCATCGKRFSIKVGTIFEDSKVPLRKWLMAIWLLTSHKKGVASTTLARDIGVTQKTSWFMLHRLRHAATTKSFNRPLEGTVEADETFVGGKEKNKHKDKRTGQTKGGKGKAIVFGVIARGGELRTKVIPNRDKNTMLAAVSEHVAPGSEVHTDEWVGYINLYTRYTHKNVSHVKGEYAKDGVHTNSIEGVWSLLKRQIIGIHHFVSSKHLSRYVDEATWRYNRRQIGEGVRLDSLIADSAGRLTYKALIA
ncbi:IS1595 family transposase [Muricoccus radiodurans]|uniref:IS1595 family transposase n=1 Tax=Muricoccus radiodurans TaxID=2231721 RepID=UPI003CF070A4